MPKDPRRHLPTQVRAILDECGLPWEVIQGKGDHMKLFISGRMAAVFSQNVARVDPRTVKHLQADVVRHLRGLTTV